MAYGRQPQISRELLKYPRMINKISNNDDDGHGVAWPDVMIAIAAAGE